jgi:hypothetical protein
LDFLFCQGGMDFVYKIDNLITVRLCISTYVSNSDSDIFVTGTFLTNNSSLKLQSLLTAKIFQRPTKIKRRYPIFNLFQKNYGQFFKNYVFRANNCCKIYSTAMNKKKSDIHEEFSESPSQSWCFFFLLAGLSRRCGVGSAKIQLAEKLSVHSWDGYTAFDNYTAPFIPSLS